MPPRSTPRVPHGRTGRPLRSPRAAPFAAPSREPAIATLPSPAPAGPAPASPVACSACDAVCCRLTVVLLPGDSVPGHLTARTREGLHVMDRDDDGWCVAIDAARMCCSIYDTRPAICRRFAMGGPYCVDVRAEYASHYPRAIPSTLC